MILHPLAGAAIAAAALLAGAGLSLPAGSAAAQEPRPAFGGEQDTEYAKQLWDALLRERMVGPRTLLAVPYEGQEPHGAMLVYLEGVVKVGDYAEVAIVKKNYLGEELTREGILNDPNEKLESITVMYRREQGYDPENQNWFWAKYDAAGNLMTTEDDRMLAGRVAGCIACHETAPGGDYVFTHNKLRAE